MRFLYLQALGAVLCASPTSAAVRNEILNRDEPLPDVSPSGPEQGSASSFNPDADTTSSIATSSTASFTNSTTSTSTSSSRSWTGTISDITERPPGLTTTQTSAHTELPTSTSSESTTSISCVSTGKSAPKTFISTSYTETTTFYGNSTDYTPPFPTLTSIPFCEDVTNTIPVPPPSVPGDETSTRGAPLPGKTTTFVTTDKNPKVVFETGPPPDYSNPKGAPGGDPGQHNTAKPDDHSLPGEPEGEKPGGPKAKPPAQPSPKPTLIITAGPHRVIIGSSTIKGLKPDQSSTVVVDDETFTILPTAVIGGGGTIEKPAPVQSEWHPTPTITNIGGLPVSASGSIVEIDGQTLTIAEDGTTTQINGQDVSLSPGQLQVGDEDLKWQATDVYNTDAIVAGGEMLTAIGSTIFVLNETTVTYGPDMTESEITVDDDVITIAPEGIVVNNSTLGGPSASHDATTYAVVGGIAITHIGSSLVAVHGHTFTVNDDSDDITTMIAGEMMTIGPDGVEMDSMTIGLGDDSNMVTGTLEPGDTSGDDGPEETGSSDEDEDEDDLAGTLRPDGLLLTVFLGLCVWPFT